MNQTNYLKLFSLLTFLAFSGVSCWATSESLHLLLPSCPTIICWIVTLVFFIIASLGTKIIVDSFNQNIYVEKRGMKLISSIFILIIFWLICSMPTNTHTFFYRNIINDKVNTDISITRGYLNQIKNNTNNKNQAEIKNEIDILHGELEAEIKNEANPGFGTKSKDILRKLAAKLGVAKIEPLSYMSFSIQDRNKLCDAYKTKIYILRESKEKNVISRILTPNKENLQEVKLHDDHLLLEEYIEDGTLDLNNAEDIKDVCDKLNLGYNAISRNIDFINFNTENY